MCWDKNPQREPGAVIEVNVIHQFLAGPDLHIPISQRFFRPQTV